MTNDEINNLTDEQINVMVTGEAYNLANWSLSDDESVFYHCGIDGNGYFSVSVLNYCNDVNVLWPLILSNSISILFDKDSGSHVACVSSWEDCAYNMQLETHHSNPLRAAAIVYLKIKGAL